MDVSIIIVSYNTKDLLYNCIKSIYDHTTDISYEIIISDNNSSDGSVAMIESAFPEVVLIKNNRNLGFGAANNKALNIAKGKYIFYLNSDTVLLNNAVYCFYSYWEKSANKDIIGVLGTNLLNPDHSIQRSSAPFPSINSEVNTLFSDYISVMKNTIKALISKKSKTNNTVVISSKRTQSKVIGKVESIVGAAMFLKNDKYASFDERFILNYEETDLEFQLFKNKKYCYLIDTPLIIHYGGASSVQKRTNDILKYSNFSKIQFFISRIKYFRKNDYSYKIIFLKIFAIFIWTSPFLIKKTYSYLPDLLKA